jgi:hypothetical protein
MNNEKRFYAILDYSEMTTNRHGVASPSRTLLATHDFNEAKATFDALADKIPCQIEISEGRPSQFGPIVIWYGLQMFHCRGPLHPAFTQKDEA